MNGGEGRRGYKIGGGFFKQFVCLRLIVLLYY